MQPGQNKPCYEFCNDAIEQVKRLLNMEFDDSVIPKGSFSKFIQVDLENKTSQLN